MGFSLSISSSLHPHSSLLCLLSIPLSPLYSSVSPLFLCLLSIPLSPLHSSVSSPFLCLLSIPLSPPLSPSIPIFSMTMTALYLVLLTFLLTSLPPTAQLPLNHSLPFASSPTLAILLTCPSLTPTAPPPLVTLIHLTPNCLLLKSVSSLLIG